MSCLFFFWIKFQKKKKNQLKIQQLKYKTTQKHILGFTLNSIYVVKRNKLYILLYTYDFILFFLFEAQ